MAKQVVVVDGNYFGILQVALIMLTRHQASQPAATDLLLKQRRNLSGAFCRRRVSAADCNESFLTDTQLCYNVTPAYTQTHTRMQRQRDRQA